MLKESPSKQHHKKHVEGLQSASLLEFKLDDSLNHLIMNQAASTYLGYDQLTSAPSFAVLDEESRQRLNNEKDLLLPGTRSVMQHLCLIDSQGNKKDIYGYLYREDNSVVDIGNGGRADVPKVLVFRGGPLDGLRDFSEYEEVMLHQLLLDIASGFICSDRHNFSKHMNQTLSSVGTCCEADRVFIFTYDQARSVAQCEYEWLKDDRYDALMGQGQTFELLAPLKEHHDHLKPHDCPDVSLLTGKTCRQWLEKLGIQSIMTAPLVDQNQCQGFLAMAYHQRVDEFSTQKARLLYQLAYLISDGINNQRSHQRLSQTIDGFQGLIRDIPGAVFQYDWKKQQFDYLSSRIESISGYASKDIIGNNTLHHRFLLTAERTSHFSREMMACLKQKGYYDLQYSMLHRDGSARQMQEKGRGYFDDQGRLIHIVGILMDITDEHQANERISSLATVIEQSSDVIVFKDLQLRIVSANSSFLKARKLSSMEDVLGKTIEEIYGEAANDALLMHGTKEDLRALGLGVGEELCQEEKWYTSGEEEPLIMRVQRFPIHDEQDVLLGTGLLAHDITEQKHVEEKLVISKNRYKGLLENLEEIVFSLDGQGRFNYITPNCIRKLGLGAQDIIGRRLEELVHPDDQKCVKRTLLKAFQGELLEVEFSPNEKSCNGIILFAQAKPIQGSNSIHGLRGTMRDITSIKREEQRRKDSEKNFRSFFETMTDMVFVSTREGNILHANRKAHQMLGYGGQWLGQTGMWSLVDPPERLKLQKNIESLLAGETMEMDCTLNKKGGSKLASRINVWPGQWRNQECLFFICKDISAEKIAVRRYNRLFESNPIPISLHGQKDMRFIEANQAMLELLGLSKEKLEDQNACHLAEYLKMENVEEITRLLKTQGRIKSYEVSLINAQGKECEVLLSIEPLEDLEQTNFLVNMVDITEQNKAKRAVYYMSVHDPLTKLHNRRHIELIKEDIDQEMNLPLTVICVDVNGLKLINDAFGHQKGDELLCIVADILRGVTGPKDELARMGGDEFLLFCPRTDKKKAQEKLNKVLESAEIAKVDPTIVSLAVGYDIKEKVSQSLAYVIENADAMMYKNKLRYGRQMRHQTIRTVLEILHGRYDKEKTHAERVSIYAEAMGLQLGMSTEAANTVRAAALLHDIGKIVVPSEILNRPSGLTEDEYEIVMRHTEAGYQILRSTEEYMTAADVALHHHEWWNGSGYPEGLRGYQLSLTVRIISVADVFDVMTGDYSYREKMSIQEAKKELLRCSGTQFDPRIVEALFAVIDQGKIE